jgi:hypothetical protein
MIVRQRGIKKVKAAGILLHQCWLIGLGLKFDDIEEVARIDEHIGVLLDNCIYRRQEIIVHPLLAEVHPALGVEMVEHGCGWRRWG